MLPILQLDRLDDRQRVDTLIERLRAQVTDSGDVAEATAVIVEDVRQRGDAAVVDYMRKWTDPNFAADRIRVSADEMAAAEAMLDPAIRTALQRSIENVRAYQTHTMPSDPPTVTIDGCELGMRFTPIPRVGLHVPGGRAAYPSSVIMLAVPAQVAGVDRLSMVSPPPTATGDTAGGDISPLVLGVAHMLGLDRVYRIGGAQAIAALTYGTESVEPVDFIAGPGNAFTQQAKRQLFGRIGIDGLFGPSEIVVLADASVSPVHIAADLVAQAEHDPGSCFLVSTDRAVVDRVIVEIEQQVAHRNRAEAIRKALAEWSAAIVVPDDAAAYELMDTIAAEHVTLAVADPRVALANVNNGGAWFLGDTSPVASGDYYAGPSHCLPTGTTARFTSGLSVYTFLKRSSVEHYPKGPSAQSISDIAALAEAEGLDGHAHSVRVRGES